MTLFDDFLQRDDPVVLDGGLATQLEAMGYNIDSELWSAALLADEPMAIVEAHRAYLEAGAECIISASYQAHPDNLSAAGFSPERADELLASSVDLAKTAREEFLTAYPGMIGRPAVAASVGPFATLLHNGSEYTGQYDATEDDIRRFHEPYLAALDSTGADVLAIETIPNAVEARVLVELLENVTIPAWVSFACRNSERINDGTLLREVAGLFAGHSKVKAVGVNCTPPQFVEALIGELNGVVGDKAIIVYPNSGETYHSGDNSWSGHAGDLSLDFDVRAWHLAGAHLIGGCCRTGPADIASIRATLQSEDDQT